MQKSNNHSVLELKLESGINKRIFLESPVLSTYPNDRSGTGLEVRSKVNGLKE